jgi:hypothetical protein
MKTHVAVLAMLLAGSWAGGCGGPSLATQRSLGAVDYGQAFAAAEGVFSQYFTIDHASQATGESVSSPEDLTAAPEGLLSSPATRRLATMQVDRQDGQVVARLTIEVQRQRRELYRQMKMDTENYSTVPNRTPAEVEAATTTEQNETWETQRYDRAMEAKILQQLYTVLHEPTTAPASAPAAAAATE